MAHGAVLCKLFNPAEIRLLPGVDLSRSACVVLDVLRATSSMVTALAHGAAAIVPADSPEHARARGRGLRGCLLAGERNRLKIPGFDLANSPPDFASPAVRGRTLVMATTNGTRAIGACRRARVVYIAALLNGSIFEMAAAYAYHLAENQPFLDGNKRAALAAALVFLDMNGIGIDDPKGLLYGAMIKIGTRKLDKQGLAQVLSLCPKTGA